MNIKIASALKGSEYLADCKIADSNCIWITGYTYGDLGGGNKGGSDSFIAKFSLSGVFQDSKNIGSSLNDVGHPLKLRENGNPWIVGETTGNIGQGNIGGFDAFVYSYVP